MNGERLKTSLPNIMRDEKIWYERAGYRKGSLGNVDLAMSMRAGSREIVHTEVWRRLNLGWRRGYLSPIADYRTSPSLALADRTRSVGSIEEIREMKTIIAILAFVLFASPGFAQQQNNKQASASTIHLRQIEELRADYASVYLSAQKSFQPAFATPQREQALCSTAHDFCPNYHGDND
jgi:hypothetical protein